MRTAVTQVNRAYQRKIKTQFRKEKGIIHKYTEEIHKIQNTMVTVYLQKKQKKWNLLVTCYGITVYNI